LPALKALLQFTTCFEKKEVVSLLETNFSFISYEDLIEDKKANARPKDITDIEELKTTRKKGN
jgi:hypothetical protein